MLISAIRQRISDSLLAIPDTAESTSLPELFPAKENSDTDVRCFAVHIAGWELYGPQRQRRGEPIDVVSNVEIRWVMPIADDQLVSLDAAFDFELELVSRILAVNQTSGLSLVLQSSTGPQTDQSETYVSGVIICRAQYNLITPL